MSAADAVRALADSGTPGPWTVDLYCSGTAIRDDQAGDVTVPIIKDADAAKIAAAVNALPKVASLIAAIDALGWRECSLSAETGACDSASCALVRARDALVAALVVTE